MTGPSLVDLRIDDDSRELLWEDGEGRFSRIWRGGADGRRQAYIAVQPALGQRGHASAERLAHEFALREELDAAWALRPLAHVRDSGVPTLLVEDSDCQPLDRVFGVPLESLRFLRLGAVLANAMGRMHARGIVHKDIKAAN